MNLSNYTREFGTNLKLAYPVIVGMLGHTVVQLIDNIMVGQLGTAELAAVSLGNSFVFVAMSLGIGFSTAITPMIAESFGAKNHNKVRYIFVHGLILCFGLGVVLGFLVLWAQPLLSQMGQPDEVVALAKPYLFWVALSLVPLVGFQGLRQFAEGLFQTRLAMYATLMGNVINVLLNYLLIFGLHGFPELGVEGAALGTLFSRWTMVLFMAINVKNKKGFKRYNRKLFRVKLKKSLFNRIFSLGLPSALQMFFEVTFFTSAIWMSGLLGKNPQAANQIALNLSSMTYMVAIGVGVTAMIRVGNEKGRGDFTALRRVAVSTFLLIFLMSSLFCLFFIATHDLLPWLYLDGNAPEISSDVNEVVEIASNLILIAAFFQIADGLQAVVLGSLRGIQDVIIPAFLIFISYGAIGFPISYYLGLNTEWATYGIWIGLLTGLILSALLLVLRFQYLSQKLDP
jgi:multidrug resistance protein, MATE family